MSDEPKLSPWGAVQHCEIMNTGIYSVDTASHGGIMIKEEYAKEILSPEALRCGFRENGYLNFEEDCAAAVAEREFLDKEIWEIPDYVKDKTEYENSLNDSIKRYFPEYWEEREKKLSANTYDKRYIVSDFLIGKPVMVDTKAKTLNFYSYNMYGQLYDLKNPEVHKVTAKTINGLIKRTQDYFRYKKTEKVVDGYIYKYLMNQSQKEQCKTEPDIRLSDKIIETNNFEQAVRKMCEWSYENNFHGSADEKENGRHQRLQYCENYLKDIKAEVNYSKNSEKKSLLQTLKENKTKIKQPENINKPVKEKNNMR